MAKVNGVSSVSSPVGEDELKGIVTPSEVVLLCADQFARAGIFHETTVTGLSGAASFSAEDLAIKILKAAVLGLEEAGASPTGACQAGSGV